MILEEVFTLSNGVAIPKLGLGTWRIENGAAAQVVRNAAEIGYRHFDTAQAYAQSRALKLRVPARASPNGDRLGQVGVWRPLTRRTARELT